MRSPLPGPTAQAFLLAIAMLAACTPDGNTPPATDTTIAPVTGQEAVADPVHSAVAAAFAIDSEALMQRMLARDPAWSIYAGRYDDADRVTIPDAARRADDLAFAETELAWLARVDPQTLPPELRIDHNLLTNRLERMRWYLTEFRDWQWDPSNYNVAGPIGLILNTPYAPEADRLRTVMARLEQVPAYYQAARTNISNPTREHTELAMVQNRGTLNLLGDSLRERVAASSLETAEKDRFEQLRQRAVETVDGFIAELQAINDGLATDDNARPFRIGADLYEAKFAYDIQSGFTARELYERAVAEKNRLHDDMDLIAVQLWDEYFPDQDMPEDRLDRIGQLIDHLSDQHIAREDFISEIERQIPRAHSTRQLIPTTM